MANPTVYNRAWGIQTGGSSKEISKLLFEKKELLVMTFANLLVQALITFYSLKKYSTEKKNRYVTIGVWIGLFGVVLLISLAVIAVSIYELN